MILAPLPMAAVTASASAPGRDPAHVGNDYMGVAWASPTGAATRTLTIDLGADIAFDTAVLLGCTGALPVWTLKVDIATAAQGAGFPAGSWSGTALPFLAGAVMPASGRGKALWFAPEASPPPAAARYVRFTIGGLGTGAAVVARVAIGKRITLARNFQFGAAFGVRELGSVDFSRRGVLIRQRGAKLRSVGVTFGSVYRDEVEAVVHPLIEKLGGTECVALITDPDAHDQRQNRIWFGPMVGDLGTVWARAAGFEWQCSIADLGA